MKRRILTQVMPNIATMWVAKDVFTRTLTWEEVQRHLAKINRESALLTMAMLNAVCSEFLSAKRTKQDIRSPEKIIPLINYLFALENRSPAMQTWQQSTGAFLPIAPPACIAMTEACLRHCVHIDGDRFEQPWQYPVFAHILLSFQEAMNGDSIQRQPINLAALTESQFAEFSRNYQTANFNNDLSVLMRRHYLMFEKTRDQGFTQKRLGCSPAKWFEQIAGMHPRQYRMFQLVALSHGKEFTLDAPDLTMLVYDLNAVLGNMRSEAADAYRRLHELAVVESSLPDEKFDDWSMAIYRAHYVRRRPILRLQGEKYLCLHRQLMAERFFVSTVHVLADLVAAHQPEGWSSESKKRTLQVRTVSAVT